MLSNITLPTLEDIQNKNNAEKIRGYLATLHDQLRYMMLNIDTENLSDGLNDTITTAAQGVAALKKSVVKLDGAVSSVTQTANKISWIVGEGTSSSDFTLTPYAAKLIAGTVDISGLVKFTDLNLAGKTTINGANIMSGTINADRLNVADLSAVCAKIGGFTLNNASISSQAPRAGSLSVNSADSPDSCWIRATDAYGYTTFYIAKSGACYFNGNYIAGGTITADKIVCDTENRIDLTNNYNGVKIGSSIVVTNGSKNCRMFINPAGVLTFDTGTGDSMFSLSLSRNGSNYTLNVLNGSGQTVGSIKL